MEDKSGSQIKPRKDTLTVSNFVKTDIEPYNGPALDGVARIRSLDADDRRSSAGSAHSSSSKSLSRHSSKHLSVPTNHSDKMLGTISKSKANIETTIQAVLNIRSHSATINRIQHILSISSHGALANTAQANMSTKSHGALANTAQANMSTKSHGDLAQANIPATSHGALTNTIEEDASPASERAAGQFISGTMTTDVFDPLLEYRRSLIGTRDGNYIKRLYREDYYEVFGLSGEKTASRTSRHGSGSQTSETVTSSSTRSRRSSQESGATSKSSGKRRKRAIIPEKQFLIDWFRKLVVREHKFIFPHDKELYPNLDKNLLRKV